LTPFEPFAVFAAFAAFVNIEPFELNQQVLFQVKQKTLILEQKLPPNNPQASHGR
jgi:hypothetical protein